MFKYFFNDKYKTPRIKTKLDLIDYIIYNIGIIY